MARGNSIDGRFKKLELILSNSAYLEILERVNSPEVPVKPGSLNEKERKYFLALEKMNLIEYYTEQDAYGLTDYGKRMLELREKR